jgi:hypothetical protein
MTAIITDTFKKQFVQTVFDEVTATAVTHRYYIGIGRSEQWDSSETVPIPTDTPRTIRNLRHDLQSIKSAADCSFVIPRHNWSSGTIYSAYDDNFAAIPDNTYYVITEDNQVYICLQQAKNNDGEATTSTIKPAGTTTKPFKTEDGYVWKFLYTLSAARANKFLSANFLPVEKILDSSNHNNLVDPADQLSPLIIQQALVQDSAVPGQIVGIAIVDGGSGYTGSAPNVVITGDGVRAAATAFIANNKVVKIEMDSSTDSAITMGQGYRNVDISFSSGNATARAILGPDNGLGNDIRDDLKSTSLMFNTKPAGTEDSNFIVEQDFRQIALIRNPKAASNGAAFTNSSGRVLQFLKLSAVGNSGLKDALITGQTSGAKALVDDVINDQLYFHQNETTGFKPFQENEQIQGGGITATLEAAGADADSDAFTIDDVDKLSGEVLYIENKAPTFRQANQTEDIKVVITL